MMSSWTSTGRATQRSASCSHCWSSRTLPPSPGRTGFDDRGARRLDEARVLRAVLETGQVAIEVVRPADHLVGQGGHVGQRGNDTARDVEDEVVAGTGQPHDDVMLGRRQRVSIGTDDRLVEPGQPGRAGIVRDGGPVLGAEPGDEVDASDRRPRLAQARDQPDQRAPDPLPGAGPARDRRGTSSRARRCRSAVQPQVQDTDRTLPMGGRTSSPTRLGWLHGAHPARHARSSARPAGGAGSHDGRCGPARPTRGWLAPWKA